MQFLRDYGVPLILAVLVHGFVVAALWVGWTPREDDAIVMRPPVVRAELVVLDAPKPKPAAPRAAPTQPAPKPVTRQEPKPTPPKEIAQPKPEPAPKRDDAAEKARQQQAETQRRQRLQSLVASSFDQALRDESISVQASEAEELAQTYAQGIYQVIVANWSRPPSARNGMETKLMVELVPTGDVVGITIVSSSGNAAFDRSAEQAVRKAGKFDVPKDSAAFERYFRRFPVLFKPEDLLR